jgi:DNA-binding MarR family transcriptional regulator
MLYPLSYEGGGVETTWKHSGRGRDAPANRGAGQVSHARDERPEQLGLANPARIRILEVLSEGERSVGELQPLVGIEASHLSQQLGVLRRAGLVAGARKGRRSSIRSPTPS